MEMDLISSLRYYKLRAETSAAQGLQECNKCGVCCQRAPCLFADAADVERVAAAVGKPTPEFIAKYVQLEKRHRDGAWIVRMRPRCAFLADDGCQIHEHRPRGAESFECWTPETIMRDFAWTPAELAKIGAV